MANNFKSYQVTNVTTESTVFTGPASTQSTVIGLSVANTAVTTATVDVKLNTAYIVKGAPVPVGGSLVIVGGDQKLVVEATDIIVVTSDQTVDVIISTLEVS